MTVFSGRCLCGSVAYEARGESPQVDACHCSMCRRWSGHYWASVNVNLADFRVVRGEDHLGWHRSSDAVSRGFCKCCGSALFWRPDRHPDHSHIIAVSAGSIDAPTGLRLSKHIFAASKGDYYDIADGLPRHEAF